MKKILAPLTAAAILFAGCATETADDPLSADPAPHEDFEITDRETAQVIANVSWHTAPLAEQAELCRYVAKSTRDQVLMVALTAADGDVLVAEAFTDLVQAECA